MKLSRFCGCCSLQTGTIIAGFLDLVGALTMIVRISMHIADNWVYCTNYKIVELEIQCAMNQGTAIGLLIYFIISSLISVLSIFGCIYKKSVFILPSVCKNFVNLMIFTAGIAGFIAYSNSTSFYSEGAIAASWVTIVLLFCFNSYLWLVIYSYYKGLVAEQLPHVTDSFGNISKFSPDYT